MSAKDKAVAIVVTTEHKGVFFGYGIPSDEKSIRITNARMCVYWSADVKSVLGLAATGPSKSCRVGPAVPAITLNGRDVGDGMLAGIRESVGRWTVGVTTNGSGYGYGDGSGDGKEAHIYYLAILEQFKKTGKRLGFWRSDSRGRPTNGGSGDPVKIGQVQEIEGPLQICSNRGLHATTDPKQWKGDRLWIVALDEPVQENGDKIASLRREILAEIPNFVLM